LEDENDVEVGLIEERVNFGRRGVKSNSYAISTRYTNYKRYGNLGEGLWMGEK
jgi:hypothetical protein